MQDEIFLVKESGFYSRWNLGGVIVILQLILSTASSGMMHIKLVILWPQLILLSFLQLFCVVDFDLNFFFHHL